MPEDFPRNPRDPRGTKPSDLPGQVPGKGNSPVDRFMEQFEKDQASDKVGAFIQQFEQAQDPGFETPGGISALRQEVAAEEGAVEAFGTAEDPFQIGTLEEAARAERPGELGGAGVFTGFPEIGLEGDPEARLGTTDIPVIRDVMSKFFEATGRFRAGVGDIREQVKILRKAFPKFEFRKFGNEVLYAVKKPNKKDMKFFSLDTNQFSPIEPFMDIVEAAPELITAATELTLAGKLRKKAKTAMGRRALESTGAMMAVAPMTYLQRRAVEAELGKDAEVGMMDELAIQTAIAGLSGPLGSAVFKIGGKAAGISAKTIHKAADVVFRNILQTPGGRLIKEAAAHNNYIRFVAASLGELATGTRQAGQFVQGAVNKAAKAFGHNLGMVKETFRHEAENSFLLDSVPLKNFMGLALNKSGIPVSEFGIQPSVEKTILSRMPKDRKALYKEVMPLLRDIARNNGNGNYDKVGELINTLDSLYGRRKFKRVRGEISDLRHALSTDYKDFMRFLADKSPNVPHLQRAKRSIDKSFDEYAEVIGSVEELNRKIFKGRDPQFYVQDLVTSEDRTGATRRVQQFLDVVGEGTEGHKLLKANYMDQLFKKYMDPKTGVINAQKLKQDLRDLEDPIYTLFDNARKPGFKKGVDIDEVEMLQLLVDQTEDLQKRIFANPQLSHGATGIMGRINALLNFQYAAIATGGRRLEWILKVFSRTPRLLHRFTHEELPKLADEMAKKDTDRALRMRNLQESLGNFFENIHFTQKRDKKGNLVDVWTPVEGVKLSDLISRGASASIREEVEGLKPGDVISPRVFREIDSWLFEPPDAEAEESEFGIIEDR